MPMEAKPYPEAKRTVLIGREVSDFIAFLGEITHGKQFIQKNLLQYNIPGFRPGHAPLTQTVQRLRFQLKRERTYPDSARWHAFKNAWKHWVGSHPELNNILSELVDNAADFDENGQCVEPPNSELDRGCFEILLEASLDNRIARETIQRFYEYGYFEADEQIEALIAKARPREEIELRQRQAALPDAIDALVENVNALSDRVDALADIVKSLASRTPTEAPANGAAQELDRRIAEVYHDLNDSKAQLKEVTGQISAVESFEARLSKTESSVTQIVSLLRRIGSLEARISELTTSAERIDSLASEVSELQTSVESFQTKPSATEFAKLKQQVGELGRQMRQMPQELQSLASRVQALEGAADDAPRVAYQAVQIGKRYAAQVSEEIERYEDENDYLSDFRFGLRHFAVTDADETEAAIHVALKAFPAIELADPRVIEVWNLVCGNHLHVTTLNVEMGWLGVQDWFPYLFSQECFEEELERIHLSASIKNMLETGDMPWAIHLSHCDVSYPESYLPAFLNWIGDLGEGGIRVFLTRSAGVNRCRTSTDVYARVARLPAPKKPASLVSPRLRPSTVVVTQSEWESWCDLRAEADDEQLDFLEKLLSALQNCGVSVPQPIFRDMQQYLRLSQRLLANTRALDWALTLRLLPWIGNRHEFINAVQTLIDKERRELPHFQEGLQQAREEA